MGLLPLVALYALFFADVPLGQPHLLYRYSPLAVLRGGAALVALAIGAIGVLSLSRWWSSDRPGARRAWACGAAAAYALLVVWTFFAPPKYAWQHLFNLQSPSHEGAFVWEARGVTSIRTYVAHGFYDRLQHRPDEMRGRRVLSNPPGMTIAIVALGRAVATMPRVQAWLQRRFGIDEVQDPTQRREFVTAIVLAMLFTLVWGGAMGFVYRLCRLWMPPPAATCVAFACIFNPSTVNFTPGKDPAQIATVALILLGWLAAYDGRGRAGAVVSGAVAAGATMFGLIHVWVAAVVAAATLWHAATG
ncbi:MAG: hypothetical protein ACE5E6_12190, partial [Phycisphaerae bacterium]